MPEGSGALVALGSKPFNFDRAIVELQKAMGAFAQSLTRNATEAEDLVQNVTLKVLTHRHQFQVGTNFRAWVFTIMRNMFYSELRRKSRESVVAPEFWDANAADETLAREDKPDVAMDLQKLLGLIEPERRKPFVQAHLLGMKYEEIAADMGVPVGTVKSRINRVRRAMLQRAERLADAKKAAYDQGEPAPLALVQPVEDTMDIAVPPALPELEKFVAPMTEQQALDAILGWARKRKDGTPLFVLMRRVMKEKKCPHARFQLVLEGVQSVSKTHGHSLLNGIATGWTPVKLAAWLQMVETTAVAFYERFRELPPALPEPAAVVPVAPEAPEAPVVGVTELSATALMKLLIHRLMDERVGKLPEAQQMKVLGGIIQTLSVVE